MYKKIIIKERDKYLFDIYNPQNEMYQKLKRNVHFAVVERGKGNKKHR